MWRPRPGYRQGAWLMSVRWARVWCFEILLTAVRAGIKVGMSAAPVNSGSM